MKILVIIVGAIAGASGCSVSTPGWVLESMNQQCATHGGIESIDNFIGQTGTCRDGKTVTPKRGS